MKWTVFPPATNGRWQNLGSYSKKRIFGLKPSLLADFRCIFLGGVGQFFGQKPLFSQWPFLRNSDRDQVRCHCGSSDEMRTLKYHYVNILTSGHNWSWSAALCWQPTGDVWGTTSDLGQKCARARHFSFNNLLVTDNMSKSQRKVCFHQSAKPLIEDAMVVWRRWWLSG